MGIIKNSKMIYKLSVLVVFLGATFFVGNLVLAACGDNLRSGGWEWDSSSALCTAYRWGITSGTASGSCWYNMCCGDDTGEYVRPPEAENIAWYTGSLTTKTCSANYNSNICSKDGVSYTYGTYNNLNLGGNDNIVYCEAPTWRDCDITSDISSARSICDNLSIMNSGENHSFGEYSDNITPGACGDDAGEYPIDKHCRPFIFQSDLCCDNPNDLIDDNNDTCVTSCPIDTKGGEAGSTCINFSDVNSPPATGLLTVYNCSYYADACIYKIYKNSTNNFSTASVFKTINLTRNVDGLCVGDDGQVVLALITDQSVTPNTQYFYWVAEYDTSNNFIVKSDAIAGYSGRLGAVSGLHSHVVSNPDGNYDSDNAILWQWDSYTGASDYGFNGSSDFSNIEDYAGFDGWEDHYSSLPPHSSSVINDINENGLASVVDYSKPLFLWILKNVYDPNWVQLASPTLIVRPTFTTQGTIACRPAAKEIVVDCTTPPAAPTNLTHSNTVNSLTWSWTAPVVGCSPVVSYNVYGRKYDEADFILLDAVASTSYTWSGLLANTKYEVKVAAVDANGRLGAFVGPAGFYTSIEQPEINCSNETINSVRLETVGAVTPPAPASVTYDLKSNFAKTGVYYGWQAASQKDVTGLSSATAYAFSLKTRNGDGDENTPTTKTCSTLSNLSVDLIIDSIDAPDYVYQGGSINASVVTKNIGNTSSGQTSKTKVFIDSNDSGAGGIATLMDTWISSLDPGAEQTKTTDAWNTTGVPVGNHQIVAITDAPNDSRINESNEGNNVLRRTIEVRAGPPPTPEDFDLLTPIADAPSVSLNPTTFSWTNLPGAISYQLYLCPSATLDWGDCSSPVQIINLATVSYSTTTLATNTGYLWQVTATTPSLTKAAKNGPRHFITANTSSPGLGPTADFTFCKYNNNTVQFNDESLAGDSRIETWNWDFGDGETCTAAGNCTETGYPGTNQYPIHTFSADTPFASFQLVWYSTLNNAAAIANPQVGSAGTIYGSPDYQPVYAGNGVRIDASTEKVKTANNAFNDKKGAIQLWYKPNYNSNTVGEPNHFIFRGDGSGGDTIELKFQNNGFYLKFYDNQEDKQCIISLPSLDLTGLGWASGDVMKLVTKWYSNTLELYKDDVLLRSQVCSGMNLEGALTIDQGVYIGSSSTGSYNANGVIDEFMLFNENNYTLTGGPLGTLETRLTVTDGEGDSNSIQKMVDLGSAPSCAYNLLSVEAYNSSSVGLVWANPDSCIPDYYYIYRSTDGVNWHLLTTQPSSSTIFDDLTVNEETTYWYYLSSSPPEIAYNNSTLNPLCNGGFGANGTKCPLSVTTPPAGISGSSAVTLSHSCGKITASWPKDANAKLYQLQRSYGANVEDKYVNIATIYSTDTVQCPASSADCSYVDNRIVPVNIVNPPAAKKYWYRLREQRNDNSWSNWSTGVEDYSYCYRAPNWQEE